MHQPNYFFNCNVHEWNVCKHSKKYYHDASTMKEYFAYDFGRRMLVLMCDHHASNHQNYGWDDKLTPICKKARGLKVCNCHMCHEGN